MSKEALKRSADFSPARVYTLWDKLIQGHQLVKTQKLLALDTSYTLEMILDRHLQEPVFCRDLEGYFAHVWSVHPYATVIAPRNTKTAIYGPLESTMLAERHTIIEGKVGRYENFKWGALLNFLLAQWELCCYLNQLIKKENCTVIRAGDPYYLGLQGLLLARMNRIPLVIRIGGNYDKVYAETGKPAMPRLFKKRWIEKIIERFVLKRADLVAGANIDNLNFAIANGARKEFSTIFRYGNLLHPSHLVAPQDRPSADDILEETGLAGHPFAIYIGRLEPVKLPDHILLTIAEIKKRGRSLNILIVGDGSMLPVLIEHAKQLDISNNVVFAGNKSQEWIARILPHATLALSPHTGRALSEVALSGIPIIAYDIDWQPELIVTGETGELVAYKDWLAMANAAIRLIDDPAYAAQLGNSVRTKALDMMDPKKLNTHEQNEYDKLFACFYK